MYGYNNFNNGFQQNDQQYDFVFEQAKKGQKKALWKNALKLGILLICYNIFLSLFSYVYQYFYYFLKTQKFTLSLDTIREYITDNLESISITEYNMFGNAFVTLLSLVSILIVARLFCKVSIGGLFKCDAKGIRLGVKAFPFSLLLNFVFSVIISVITAYFAQAGVVIPEANFDMDRPTFTAGFSMFLYMVILAPIIEEVVYRGFVMKFISPYGKRAAIFVSAFIFGFMHGNLSQFVTAFAVGIVFAAVAVHTNSILPTVIMHMLNNGINFISLCAEGYDSEVCNVIYSILFVGVLLLGVMEVFLFRKIIKKKTLEPSLLTYKETYKTIFLNPAILIYLAMLLVEFVYQIIEANVML